MSVILPFWPRQSPFHAANRATMTPALRRQIEATIEALIDVLDAADGSPDMEPDADAEPSLGWSLSMALGTADDQEASAPEWEVPTSNRRPTRSPHHSQKPLPRRASSTETSDFPPVDSPAAT
ncbi:hypothetical protein ACP4J4_20380 (plasmid) [Aureimonas ureilytica]|uniref:hypothetical protein n=1 Tax=Aureimonas ureilytica TaxID=401562 RepID=UPI003CF20D59